MKKLIAALLLVALVAALATTAVFASGCSAENETEEAEPEFRIGIISDTHVVSESQIVDINSESWRNFDDIGQKMLTLSEAILKTTVDRFIEEGSVDCVLVSGDTTEDGATVAHKAVATQFARLEAAGIPVYVMNGNHDLNRGSPGIYTTEGRLDGGVCSPSEFVEIYNEFGYSEALAKDTKTLSYTADIGGNYRLIVMDTCFYEQYEGVDLSSNYPYLTDELLAWVVAQIEQAVADGKTPIGMSHIPMLQHLGDFVGSMGFENSVVNNGEKVRAALVKAGLEITFCGHMHANDAISYTDANGTLNEFETGCLCNTDSPVRYIEFYDDYYYCYIDDITEIPGEYIPSYITTTEKAAILADFPAYASQYFNDDLMGICLNNIGAKTLGYTILNMLGLDTEDAEVKALADSIYEDLIMAFLDMPIYKEDAKDGEWSLEAICDKYGVSLEADEVVSDDTVTVESIFASLISSEVVPDNTDDEVHYKSITDAVMAVAKMQFAGDESATSGSVEGKILRYGVYSIFYCLNDFDIFGKLHALDETVPDIDLTNFCERLFKEEVVDLSSDKLIIKLFNFVMPIIGDFLPDSLSMLKKLSLSEEKGDPAILFNLLKGFGSLEIFGVKIGDYVNFDNGTILIGKLLDEFLWNNAAYGTIVDVGLSDRAVIIKCGE